MARVMNSVDILCTHEKIFRPESIENPDEQITRHDEWTRKGYQAECSWLAVPYLGSEWLRQIIVVHVVRHPRNVIRSLLRTQLLTNTGRYRKWQKVVRQTIPELFDLKTGPARAAYFWIEWNRRIVPHADATHRIEDDAKSLLEKLDIAYKERAIYNDRTCNTRCFASPKGFELTQLPERLLGDLTGEMKRYGYTIDNHELTVYEREGRVGAD